MKIFFVIKPYAINMYSLENDTYSFIGTQDITHIENEKNEDYENRMIYVCKDLSHDFVNTNIYKENKKKINSIVIILTNPWCVYEVLNLEKDFDKEQVIDKTFMDNVLIHKDVENTYILKNNIYNISINGYDVKSISGQKAHHIHLQYLSIYGSKNFLNKLSVLIEKYFHLHNIEIDSVYSYINDNLREGENQLKIIIEDQGIDISYIYQNKNIANYFIHYSGFQLKNKLKELLHVDDNILNKILQSKICSSKCENNQLVYDKSLNNIWPDLDGGIKDKINQYIDKALNDITKEIKVFIDEIGNEYIGRDTKINIYCIDENSYNNIGLILHDFLKNDQYILDKLLTNIKNIFTKKIF